MRGKLYYRLLPLVFAGFFGMMIFGFVFNPDIINKPAWIPIYLTELFGILLYTLLILSLWTYIKKQIIKFNSPKFEKKFLIVFFPLIIICQILFSSQMSVPINPQCFQVASDDKICVWDFNFVTQEAINATNTDNMSDGAIDYLHRHQNNIPVFYLLKLSFEASSALGIDNLQLVGIAFNIIAINVSLALIYLVARKFMDVKKAIFSLVVASFVMPLVFMYAPIFYTDTLSLPFPIAILYLYIRFRDSKSKRESLLLLTAISLLSFIGSMIKFTVIIMLIAIMIDMIVRTKKPTLKVTVLSLSTIVIILVPLFTAYGTLSNKYIHSRAQPDSITTPWTHYIMMGMGTDGRYSIADDYATSNHKTVSSAIDYNVSEIKKRLSERGPLYVYFLYTKAINTWTTGDYEARYRLSNTGVVTDDYKPSAFQKIITSSQTYPLTFSNFLRAIQALLIMSMMLAAIVYYSKRRNDLSIVIILSLFGLAVFLLLWEANSRYTINYIPLMIVLATPILWEISTKTTASIKKNYLIIRQKVLHY